MMWLLACAFSPGTGFATFETLTFSTAFDPGEARDLGDNTVLTDLGLAVTIESFEVDVARLALEELSGGVSFDPAAPPDGYSLCHGGHCHAEDGALVPYADIEAELAGDAAQFLPVVELEFGQSFDVLTQTEAQLVDISLPNTTVRRLRLDVDEARLSLVIDGTPFSADLVIDASLTGGFDLTIDRGSPATLSGTAVLGFDGTLFDQIAFEPGWESLLLASILNTEPTMEIQ